MNKFFKKEKGFTIVELVIAIFILFVAVFGVYSAFSTIVALTLGVSDRLTAAYLAQEGIEIIRNMRDYNWVKNLGWNNGLTGCASGCEADYTTGTAVAGSWLLQSWIGVDPSSTSAGGGNILKINTNGFYVYGGTGSDTKFKRKITITISPSYMMKVNVKVFWSQKGNWSLDVVEVEDNLYNWY